jgi:hypothetical protein
MAHQETVALATTTQCFGENGEIWLIDNQLRLAVATTETTYLKQDMR